MDKIEEDEKILDKLEKKALPQNMQTMNNDERKAYVKGKKAERERIQKELVEFEKKVKTYINENNKPSDQSNTLDKALIGTMQKQAQQNNFKFKN